MKKGFLSCEPGVQRPESASPTLNLLKKYTMGDYRDFIVYQKAYKLAMDIFATTKKFLSEEKNSQTDQIRRSSHFVCANLVEAYCRRKYKAHFLSKLTDSETENAET